MAIIVDIDHNGGDLTEYTSTVTDGGDLSVTAGAALAGSAYGLNCYIDDTVAMYGQHALSSPYSTTGIVRLRFYFDPNGFTLGAGHSVTLMYTMTSGGNSMFGVQVDYSSGYRIAGAYLTDVPSQILTSTYSVTDEPHYIEVLWKRATTNVASNGEFQLWIDGVSKYSVSNIDNFDYNPDYRTVRLGPHDGLAAGDSGTFFMDELVVNDDGSLIGPVGAPTLIVADAYVTSQVDAATVSIVSAYLRPSADVTDGSWTNELGTNTNLYASVDEESAGDTDFIQSEALPSSSAVVLQLSSGTDPAASNGHVLRYRYAKTPSNGAARNLTVELRQGYVSEANQGTLIATWTHTGISGTLATAEQTLSSSDADTITDYTSLFVRFVAS